MGLGGIYISTSLTTQEHLYKTIVSRRWHTRSGQKSRKVSRKQLLLPHGWAGEVSSLELNLSHQIKARNGGSGSPKPHWSACVCILLATASDSHIPPRLAALPALASCSDTTAFSQATSGVSSEEWVQSLNSLPDQKGCSSMAVKWKRGTAPQADSWKSLKYVGRYLSLRLQGLSQKIHTHIKRSLTDRSKGVWHGRDTSLKLGDPLLCLDWGFFNSFSSTFLLYIKLLWEILTIHLEKYE